MYDTPVNAFKWKHFVGEIILQTVRWYLKYALSHRNLEEIMAERGIKIGCGAKIIFPQFDIMIFTFVYLFPGDKID